MGLPTVEEEKNILFQGIGVHGELRNSSFIIRPTSEGKFGIFEIFSDIPRSVESGCIESDLLEMTSTLVDSSLYIIGGQEPIDFELSNSIRWLDIRNSPKQWEIGKLPFPCADPVIGVYKYYLFILPGVWKYGYYDEDEDAYLTNRKGCIWDTKEKKLKTEIDPPKVDGEDWQWRRIRACTALDEDEDEDEGGLLIAMDGEKKNFFLYKPEKNGWKTCDFEDPLPEFIGETSFAASNGRLYILEVRGTSPAFLYIYDIKAGKLVMDEKPILEFDDDLWSMDEWDRVVRIVPVADDKLCFLWLGPVSYENENMWPPVRILHHLKVKFSINPNPCNSEVEDSDVEVEDSKVEVEVADGFLTNITNLLDCLPCDPEQFRAEVEGRRPLYRQLGAFQKQREGDESAEAIRTSSISGELFQDQAQDIASHKVERKRKRTLLEDPLSPEQERAKRKVEQGKAVVLENKLLCDVIASLKAQKDEFRKRLAEEKVEQYAVREKERREYIDKGGFNATEPGQSSEAKNPSLSSGDDDEIIESEVELDNTDVVEPDNDPPQKMGDPSVEVTEERRDAAESEKLKADDAISEGKLGEAIDYLTEAIVLNPKSAILYASRASVFVKLNKPNAAIRDANAAFEIDHDSAKRCKIRGMANAMLGCWEKAENDLHMANSSLDSDEGIGSILKKVELNVQKIKEHRMKYERLRKEREIKRAVKLLEDSFSIYGMLQQKSKQDLEDLEPSSAFNDGQVIGIHSISELETKLYAATKTSRLAILYFTTELCLPSVFMSPFYTSLAEKYPNVIFLKVDLDEAGDFIEHLNIRISPYFLFIRNGKVVDIVAGRDEDALERKTAQYAGQS